jgi:ATP-dependent Lon protease
MEKNETGVATGLAWTPVGGEVLFVEATIMKGKGGLTLTGQLGDVMKESAQAAMSYIRSKAADLHLPEDFYANVDIHVHVPAGAIPKDGPSAGVTMTTALVSALTKVQVKKEVAMTGEITLRGKVLPIGGLKEKILAAIRAGITTIIIPKQNEKDLEEVPKHILRKVDIVTAEVIDDVLKVALENYPPPPAGSVKHTPSKGKAAPRRVMNPPKSYSAGVKR